MRNEHPFDAPQPGARDDQAGRGSERWATILTVIYSIVIICVALWGGALGYGWARDRILSALPEQAQAAQAAVPTPGTAAAAGDAGAPAAAPAAGPTPRATPINVLLMGTDERPNEAGPARTDTIILATLDPASQTAGMLSLPRDLWVTMPGINETTKINLAYQLGENSGYPGGGPQLALDTVSSFVGQPVPHYVRINFNGFTEVVDLIGGIDINVPKTIHDEAYPTADEGIETFHLDAGFQHMDGATALKYARTRNVDDDYGRSGRQQDVIRAVFDKVSSAEMLPTLLANAPRLLAAWRNNVDTNIPLDKMLEWATEVSANPPREIRQLVLDRRYGEETYSAEGAWILVPDRTKVRAAVSAFFTPPAGMASATDATAKDDPSTVHVEILNGTGQMGMAAATRDALQAQGWKVVSIGDADRGDYGQTVVINYGVSDVVVNQLSTALGLQPSTASVSGLNPDTHVDVRIVLGQDILR